MIEHELKNCKECIAYERCPSGQRNPITRICYSDEYLAQEYAKVEAKNERNRTGKDILPMQRR